MSIRPKTKRRVLILLTIVALAAAGLGWAYAASVKRNQLRIVALRKNAMASFAAGDYATSVGRLGEYLEKSNSRESDAAALLAYGKSRVKVEMPRHQEIYEGIQIFQQYLGLRPGDIEAQKLLLNLYVQGNYNQEAIKLADAILAGAPDDVDALRGKMSALNNQRAYEPALAVSQRLNDVAPTNLEGQLATLWLMQASKKGNDQIVARGEAVRQQHSQDARFDMVAAYAYHLAGREQESHDRLAQAARRTPADAEFVIALLKMLDQNGMFDDAAALLRRSAESSHDPRILTALAQRLWQDGDIQGLLARTADLDSKSAQSDSRLLGYRALALYESGKTAEGLTIVDALAARVGDGPAAAWSAALRVRVASPPLPFVDRVKKLLNAASRDPANPVIRMMLGNARAEMGETEPALSAWNETSAVAPSWALPAVMSAKALAVTGRYADAVRLAQDGYRRAPGHYDTTTTLAEVWFASLSQAGGAADYKDLLDLLEKIQSTWHDPQTLPTYVAVLLRSGKRDAAVAALKSAAAVNPPLPAGVLLQLAAISDSENLELGGALREQAQQAGGITPQVAFAQARALADAGKTADGLALLQERLKGHQSESAWRLALARYRDATGDPAALREWLSLGDQFPADLQVQTAILQSPATAQDRAFWQKSIDRVHALTGEQGLLWRTERARWLLAGELSEKDKGEAINLLTDVTRLEPGSAEPHRLLAIALLRVGQNNASRAITELAAAAQALPGDPLITSELVPLLIENNRADDAVGYLNRLSQTPRLSSPVRHWIARQFITLDKNDRAIALLESERQAGGADEERDGLLAGLYRGARKPELAEPLYRGLLQLPVTDPSWYAQAADFFAGRQDMATAEMFMARVGKMPLKPGAAEVIRGQFSERWKNEDDALEHYTAATVVAPMSEGAWGSLAGFLLRHQKLAQSVAAADEGLKAVPNGEALKALRRHAVALQSVANPTAFAPLADLLSRNPQDVPAGELLAALVEADRGKASPDVLAARAKEVADKYPASMPVQVFAAQAQLTVGRLDRALPLVQRAAQSSPSAVEPQTLLARIYLDTGDWSRALQAVARWKQLSPDQPVGADLVAAKVYLQQPRRDPAAALQALAPDLARPLPQQQKDAVLALYARALIGAGRADEAAALLHPLLSESKAWRLTWLELAGAGHKDMAAADNWIGQVVSSLAPGASDEQTMLASAWYTVGTQFNSSSAFQSARDALKPLIEGTNPSGQNWMLWALTTQALGDLQSAESGYRKSLQLSPTSADAENDLAYVLWLRGRKEDFAEGMRLAQAAVASAPEVASYYDTLARIQGSSGQIDSAIKSFRMALQKDAGSLEAMIGLADLLAQDPGKRDEAKNLLAEVNRRLKFSPPLSPPLLKQLDVVRSAVARSF